MKSTAKLKLAVVFLSVVYIFKTAAYAAAPSFSWARSAGGTGMDYGTEIAVDALGNTYVVGRYENSPINFGDGVSLTNGNFFITKYDAAGAVVWAKAIYFPNPGGFYCRGLVSFSLGCDTNGSLFVGGSFYNAPLTLDGTTIANPPGSFYFKSYLAKYDGAGTLQWLKSTAQPDDRRITALTIDAHGSCYVAGDYSQAPSVGLTNLAAGEKGIYIAKFDGNGSNVWARSLAKMPPDAYRVFPQKIVVGDDGSYAVAGNFEDAALTFDDTTLTNHSTLLEIYAARYNADGDLLWAKCIGGINHDYFAGFGGDEQNNFYVSGVEKPTGPPTTNQGNFIIKLDSMGEMVWRRNPAQFGPKGEEGMIVRMIADRSGNSYVMGKFDGPGYLLAGDFIFTNTLSGPRVNWFTKFDANGDFVWAKTFGNPDSDTGCDWIRNIGIRADIAIDATGNLSLTGNHYQTSGTYDGFSFLVDGVEDVFVARIEAERPRLEILRDGNNVIVTWPTNQNGYVLECAGLSGSWSGVTNSVSVVNSANTVTNQFNPAGQLYRLRKL